MRIQESEVRIEKKRYFFCLQSRLPVLRRDPRDHRGSQDWEIENRSLSGVDGDSHGRWFVRKQRMLQCTFRFDCQ